MSTAQAEPVNVDQVIADRRALLEAAEQALMEIAVGDRSRTAETEDLFQAVGWGAGDVESLSPMAPYLEPPASGPRLPVKDGTQPMRVALVWAGDPAHPSDRYRSAGLKAFTPILDMPGAVFHGLQVGPAASQIQDLGLDVLIEDLSPLISDFADTASLLQDIDLLITVDTSVAHLAGAMNKDVWVLIPFAPDWRWQLRRKDSPWYPSMTLFRQTSPGDWDDVFARLRSALARLTAQ